MPVKIPATQYKLKSPKVTGEVVLTYRNGRLANIDGFDVELSEAQWSLLLTNIPPSEAALEGWQLYGMQATQLVPRSVKDKVAAFCAAHHHYRGIAYQPKLLEKANLKEVVVSPELLKVFFESPLQNFTLKNYIDRINITRDQAKNGRAGTGTFPNRWDAGFAGTLSPEQLSQYRAHLRNTGLVYDGKKQTWLEPDK